MLSGLVRAAISATQLTSFRCLTWSGTFSAATPPITGWFIGPPIPIKNSVVPVRQDRRVPDGPREAGLGGAGESNHWDGFGRYGGHSIVLHFLYFFKTGRAGEVCQACNFWADCTPLNERFKLGTTKM